MAWGDRTEARFAGPAVMSTSNATIATVPIFTQWITKQFVFTNTSGAEALVYLAIGTSATVTNRILNALPIAANDVVIWDTALFLYSGETLQGYADRSGVNITIMGWEKEA